MTSIDQLTAAGGFVDPVPVRKEIEWRNDEGKVFKFIVFISRQSFGAIQSLVSPENVDRVQGAQMISLSVGLGPDGKEKFSYEQAYHLAPSLAWAFVLAINEVSAPKNSQPLTKSGTNLSLRASAATPSRKQKSASAMKSSRPGARTAPSTAASG